MQGMSGCSWLDVAGLSNAPWAIRVGGRIGVWVWYEVQVMFLQPNSGSGGPGGMQIVHLCLKGDTLRGSIQMGA